MFNTSARIFGIILGFLGTCGVEPVETEKNTSWTPFAGVAVISDSSTPQAAFAISGRAKMGCENQLALCKVHNCKECEYKGMEEKCPLAKNKSEEERRATIAQAYEVYDKCAKAGRKRKRMVYLQIERDMEVMGWNWGTKVNELTRPAFRELMKKWKDPKREGGAYSDNSMETALQYWKGMFSAKFEDEYNDRGLDLPTVRVPYHKAAREPAQEVSDRILRNAEIWGTVELASGTERGREIFISLLLGMEFGMSWIDVCWAKWNIFVMTARGVKLVYRRRKTGVEVVKKVSMEVWRKIRPLIGRADEYILPVQEKYITNKVKREGMKEYGHSHRLLKKEVNAWLRSEGIDGGNKKKKAFHALRKGFETRRTIEVGLEQAAKETGNTPCVARAFYVGSMENILREESKMGESAA